MTQSPLAERPQQDQEIRVRGSAPNFLHRGQFAYLGKEGYPGGSPSPR